VFYIPCWQRRKGPLVYSKKTLSRSSKRTRSRCGLNVGWPHWACDARSLILLFGTLSVSIVVLESVCYLLVLNSVTSTLQWIRQLKPRDGVHDVCVFVCKCVLGSQEEDTCVSYEEEDTCVIGSPGASQPLNIRLCLLKALWLSHFACKTYFLKFS